LFFLSRVRKIFHTDELLTHYEDNTFGGGAFVNEVGVGGGEEEFHLGRHWINPTAIIQQARKAGFARDSRRIYSVALLTNI